MLPIALLADPAHDEHFAPHGHPEREDRIPAALAGLRRADLMDACQPETTRPATFTEMSRVHDERYLLALEHFCMEGGGHIDGDTFADGPGSWRTATVAAGSGLVAIEALKAGRADVALCTFRPPGHHALPHSAMGFCLVNNIAVAAASLVAEGERVVIIDWDVHHGNGTQAIFYNDPNVLYVSTHEDGAYPGTGHLHETGGPDAPFTNLNLPLPSGATGDVMAACFDEVVLPVAERFRPTWVLVSAGFDAHRDDPLADLRLTSADFGDMAKSVMSLAGKGRTLFMLEGGYDLRALGDSVGATLAASIGESYRPDAPSSGGPGRFVIDAARAHWSLS
jgi:acetoin utilization deacetylase AcuC-like enzyme